MDVTPQKVKSFARDEANAHTGLNRLESDDHVVATGMRRDCIA